MDKPKENPNVTTAFKLYYDNVLSKMHNNHSLIGRWGADPSRFETQIMCHKTGSKVPDTNLYECDGEVFGPQRWPYDSNSNPYYSDPPIKYVVANRLKAIGTSWWDWKNKRTIGLGYDFDSLIDHPTENVGVPQDKIDLLDNMDVPWLEVVRSTRGNGRHLYIWFDPDDAPVANNHNEHAAIAKSFIPLIAQHTGLDIATDVDCKGLIMWIHHVNATKENQGYSLIKPSTQILTSAHVPPNWRDNLEVVSGVRTKVRVQGWTADGTLTSGDELDEMTQAHAKVPLDDVHIRILEDLERTGHSSLWVHDHHLWQGHTGGLKQVYDDWAEAGHPMKGLFDTDSHETDPGKPNCFMRPKANGAWDVYRFGEGTGECELWDRQGKWTHITYNYPATLRQICTMSGGFEGPDTKAGFLFNSIEEIERAMSMLESKITIPRGVTDDEGRTFSLRSREDGKVVLTITKLRGDKPTSFPRFAKTTKGWERILDDAVDTTDQEAEEAELWSELDDKFRCLKVNKQFDSWVVKDAAEEWVTQPRENIKSALVASGYTKPDPIIGGAILRSWILVNKPFAPEYPGGRMWNRNAPQFIYQPIGLKEDEVQKHPTWDRVMNHCGIDLDQYIKDLTWCEDWGIVCGGDYLKAWVACMFRDPFGKLPYLFMYGPQNSGKSSFHESLSLLMTRGVEKADRALTSKSGYNGELEEAVLAVVDEVDISKAGGEAYNKLKEWTTAIEISIHAKYKQPKMVKSTLHFVQMANTRNSLPVFPGDTRITAMNVPSLEEEIPRYRLQELLREEAPHFMRTLVDWEIPEATGRLMLPVIETQGKTDAAELNMTPLERFIDSHCFRVDGCAISMSDFYNKFSSTLEEYQISEWRENDVRKAMAEWFPVGRGKGNVTAIGNISFSDCEPSTPYTKSGNRLIRENEV
jgi:hypothetical protein